MPLGTVKSLTWPGWALALAVFTLLGVGLACIYVTDTHYAAGHDGPRNAAKQAVYIGFSLAAGLMVMRVGYHGIARHAYLLLLVAVAMLIPLAVAKALHTSFGGIAPERNGAHRWIQLPGVQVQPSELFKPAYILALAWFLRYRRNYRRFRGLLIPFFLSAVPFGLILMEPDLGMALLMAPVLLVMLYAAGARLSHMALIVALALAALPLAWGRIQGYQRARVTAVLLQSESLRRAVIEKPEDFQLLATKRQALEWAASTGYQLVQSKNAIGSGGLTGQGWGAGTYVTHPLLPDRHNDFVFAIIGHQFGWIGCAVVAMCYLVIVAVGLIIASSTIEPVGRLVAVGVTTLLGAQAAVNMAMTVGLAPVTGITLPFVSHGGSSLLSCAILLALLVSVSQRRPFLLEAKPFEFTRRGAAASHPAEARVAGAPTEALDGRRGDASGRARAGVEQRHRVGQP